MSELPFRRIIHIGCDRFYAALEMREDPSLRGQALTVAGAPDKRGVVAPCSSEARAYG
ncbi:Y-family DNA polymerase, partial [Pseudomonas aeruginosa]